MIGRVFRSMTGQASLTCLPLRPLRRIFRVAESGNLKIEERAAIESCDSFSSAARSPWAGKARQKDTFARPCHRRPRARPKGGACRAVAYHGGAPERRSLRRMAFFTGVTMA